MVDVAWFDLDDGGRLPYVRLGGGQGPTVVVLPGLSDGLLPLFEERARAALRPMKDLPFQVLLLSYRERIDGTPTTRDLADDVADFIARRLDGPVTVTGHSMGGMVAQHLAGSRPELVSHLVLTATLAAPVTSFVRRIERWRDLVVEGQWRAFYRDAIAASYTGGDQLRRRVALQVLGAKPVPQHVDRHRRLAEACLSHDSRTALDRIDAPTLVIAGERDAVVPPHASRAVAEVVPGAEFVLFDHAAHGFPEQYPHRTYREVARFLDLDPDLSRMVLGDPA